VAITVGGDHNISLRSDGSIFSWGEMAFDSRNFERLASISAGTQHSLALKDDGSIVGWGRNVYGEATPPEGNDFVALAAGGRHSLALKTDGSIIAWGYNEDGRATPPTGNDFVAIAAAWGHSLALKDDGCIVGWGRNNRGQATPPTGNDFVAIAAGSEHSLALKTDGSIVGWGNDKYGEATPPGGNDFVAIAAGDDHSLALKTDGSIVGWGGDWDGQATPPTGNDFVAIDAGFEYSLALKGNGSIVGWGADWDGQATPPDGNDFVAIAAGAFHSLALKGDGSIVGWGYNEDGQATPPTGNDFVAIAVGDEHSLALKTDGSIVGWGSDDYGKATPPGGNGFVAIAAGDDHSLALIPPSTEFATVEVSVEGIAEGDISAAVLSEYGVEVQRLDEDLGSAPDTTVFSFESVPYGADYSMHIYCWDNLVGQTELFSVSSSVVSRIIQAAPKDFIVITAMDRHYDYDRFCFYCEWPIPGLRTVLESHDGHDELWHERAASITEADGSVLFHAWPGSYRCRFYDGSKEVDIETTRDYLEVDTGTHRDVYLLGEPNISISPSSLAFVGCTAETAAAVESSGENEPPTQVGTPTDLPLEPIFKDCSTEEIATRSFSVKPVDPRIARSRTVTIDLQPIRDSVSHDAGGTGQGSNFLLNLFEDKVFVAIGKRIEKQPDASLIWLGHIHGEQGSSVAIALEGNALAASVRLLNGEHFYVKGVGGQTHQIEQLDHTVGGGYSCNPIVTPTNMLLQRSLSAPLKSGESVIDLLIVYTDDARVAQCDDEVSLRASILLAVAESNMALENSQVSYRFRLVHMAEVSYVETGDSHTDIERLRSGTDGYLDEVHDLRDAHGADLAQLPQLGP